MVEQIQNEEEVAVGEAFFTSGEDRVFPRGFPVGTVVGVANGNGMKDVRLNLSGSPSGVEEVLVVLDGVHQPIPIGVVPEEKMASPLPPPPPDDKQQVTGVSPAAGQTEADRMLQKYQELGKEQNHVYGALYSNMPNFVTKPAPKPAQPAATAPAGQQAASAPPAVPKPATPGPVVLGAPVVRPPGTATHTPLATASHATPTGTNPPVKRPAAPKQVLPLGSPRPKTPATTATKPPASTSPTVSQPQ